MKKIKKALAIFMTVLMVVSMMNVGASAATYTVRIQSGTAEGVMLKETLSDGTPLTEDMLSLTTNSSSRITLPDEAYFERENYVQDGWTKTAKGTGTVLKFGSSQAVRSSTTFYPHWQQLVFTVTFGAGTYYDATDIRNYTDSTMTTLLEATTKTDGTSEQPVVFPDAMFYREGYTQTGWSTTRANNGTGTKYEFGSTYEGTISKDMTFYPFWEIDRYTVSYLPGEYGEGTETSVLVDYNKTFYLENAIFTREGYTQTGWSLIDGGEKVYDLGQSGGKAIEDVTLYPYWEENQCGSNLTHTWEDNVCTVCGKVCGIDMEHIWKNGVCAACGAVCGTDVEHTWENGVCRICGTVCGTDIPHTFENCVCKGCGIICGTDMEHIWEKGSCSICGLTCEHNYENGICPICSAYEPAILVSAENYEALNLTEDYLGYYAIGNAGQLNWFRDFVNSKKQLSGTDTEADKNDDVYSNSANGVLIRNVDLNPGVTFVPEDIIYGTGGSPNGTYDENGNHAFGVVLWESGIGTSWMDAYAGVFDGNSFTVSGLAAIDNALFNYNVGVIKNLNISNGCTVNTGSILGIFCYFNTGEILNCNNYSGIIPAIGDGLTAGICGNNYEGKISGCANYGYVYNGAGICIMNNGDENCGIIENCYNASPKFEYLAVGIAIYNCGIIRNCYNIADFTDISGAVGICVGNVDGAIIENCYNAGDVNTTGDGASGICVTSTGGTIRNCFNSGIITSGGYCAGAICGLNEGAVIENCYYLEGCATDGEGVIQNGIGNKTLGMATEDIEGSTMAKTAEEFASGEVCYLLNAGATDGTQAFYQNIDNGEEVNSTPVFSGGTVYKVGPCTGIKEYTNIEADAVCEHIWRNDVCSTCGLSMLKSVSDKTKIDHTGKSIFTELLLCKSLDEIVTVIEGYTTKLTASFGDYIGTGSKVEVLDSDANTVSTYTVVVENDVNGDSVCDVLDCVQVARVTSGYDSFDGAYKLAADSDNNGEIDINDYQSIVNAALQ